MSPDCIFCKIADRSIPTPLVYEDSEVVAFQDLNPQAAHHILIIPRQHFADVGEAATAGHSALLGKIVVAAPGRSPRPGSRPGSGESNPETRRPTTPPGGPRHLLPTSPRRSEGAR